MPTLQPPLGQLGDALKPGSAQTWLSGHGQLHNSIRVPRMWQHSGPSTPGGSPHGDSQARQRQLFLSIAVTQKSTQFPPACPQQCMMPTSHSLQPAWCGRGQSGAGHPHTKTLKLAAPVTSLHPKPAMSAPLHIAWYLQGSSLAPTQMKQHHTRHPKSLQ